MGPLLWKITSVLTDRFRLQFPHMEESKFQYNVRLMHPFDALLYIEMLVGQIKMSGSAHIDDDD